MSYFTFGGSSKTSSGLKSDFGASSLNTQKAKDNFISNSAKINPSDFVPKRFGLRYDPPTIILEYLVPSSGKLYHHKMRLNHLKSVIKNQELIDHLRKKHGSYLPADKVSDQQLNSLIEKIKQKLGESEASDSRPTTGSAETRSKSAETAQKPDILTLGTSSYKPSTQENNGRNGTNTLVLPSFGSEMATGKQASFGLKLNTFSTDSTTKKPWNDENSSTLLKNSATSDSSKNKTASLSNSNGFWDVDDDDDKGVDYSNTNLNKLSTEELEKHKKKMDVLFMKNQKKPGDPDFVYDVRQEFHPSEKNEWDDEL